MTDEQVARVAKAISNAEIAEGDQWASCSLTVRNEYRRMARAAIEAIPLPQWQAIETAPRDGTEILLGSAPDQWICLGFYETDGDRGWYRDGSHWTDADSDSVNPTHWKTRPAPPASQP